MVNRVTLIGNLGADPEIRNFENGVKVARLRVATNESYKDRSGQWQDRTEWHDVVAWRQLAERAERTLHKGTLIYIDGKLTHRTWEDDKGNKRRTTEVEANYFRILNKRENSASGPRPEPAPSNTGPTTEERRTDPPQDIDPADDLPF